MVQIIGEPIPCNDQHDEIHREDIFREHDYDMPYKETRETYYCKRSKGHEGDHKQIIDATKGLFFWWRATAPKSKGPFVPLSQLEPPTRIDPTKREGTGRSFLARLFTKESKE